MGMGVSMNLLLTALIVGAGLTAAYTLVSELVFEALLRLADRRVTGRRTR